ncbi:MAG: putative Ig domain-containing protein, partial [Terriglobales bacterium]
YYLNTPGGADGCTLQVQPTNVILSNIPNPTIVTDPGTLANPAVSNPAVSNATVAVPPGETVQITLRISPGSDQNGNPLPPLTPDQVQQQVLNNVTPVVVSHAVNTQNLGQTNPQPPISLTITTKALPNANLNVAYSQQVAAIGGVINPPTTNYTWSLFSGNLPPGLSISSSGTGSTPKVGLISGTPTAGGTYNFVVQVADAATPTAHVAQQALSISLATPLSLNVTPSNQPATQGQTFTENLGSFASGGTAPYTWSVNPPNPLPGVGLALNTSTGQITGIPTATGTVSFTVVVKDSSTPQQTAQQVISIQVVTPLAFTLPATQVAAVGAPFSENLSSYTSGGLPPYTYTVASGLTAPFTLNGSTISGTASGTGGATFSIKVTDNAGNSLTLPQTITISSPLSITSIQPSSTVAAGFGQIVTLFTSGIPGSDPVTVNFTQGANPAQAGFVFMSGANVYYVRLPSGLSTGATNVVVTDTNTNVSSAPFAITVSTTPAAPVENFVYGLSTPPPANSGCGSGISGSPVTTVTAGQGIVVFAYGVDTTGATASFSDGTHTITANTSCSGYSTSSLGVGNVFTVPAGLNLGAITVKIETTVNSVTSGLSNAISLTLGAAHLSYSQQPATTGNAFQTMSPVKVQALDPTNAPVVGVPVTLGFGSSGCSTPSSATYAISAITTGGQVTVTTAASVWPYLYASISGTGTALDSPRLVRIASVQDSQHFTLASGSVAASTGNITVYYTSYPLANISNTGGGTLVSATVQSFTANIAPALLIGQWVTISNASPSSFNTTAPVQVVNAGLLEGGYTISYNQSGTSGTATVPGMVTIVQLGGTLTQTTDPTGTATFNDLQINTGGTGYT